MVAAGAYFRGLGASEFIAAHETLPRDGLLAFPHGAFVHLLEVGLEAFHVGLFHGGDSFEVVGDFGKSFFLGRGCGLKIEIYTFFALLADGNLEVLGGGADDAGVDGGCDVYGSALKHLEEDFAMVEFVGRGLAEHLSVGEKFSLSACWA